MNDLWPSIGDNCSRYIARDRSFTREYKNQSNGLIFILNAYKLSSRLSLPALITRVYPRYTGIIKYDLFYILLPRFLLFAFILNESLHKQNKRSDNQKVID